MNRPRRTIVQSVTAAVVLLVFIGLAAPFLNGNRFKEKIRVSMERALGRRVEIRGDVHFNLFTGPGFTAGKVVIHEDPSIGIEPLAYVTSLQARPRLRSLWTRRLELATLRLDETSVNLARSGNGRWNFEPFLSRKVLSSLPDLRLTAGRINFKAGDAKSVFYLANTDLDISPPAPGRTEWTLRFSGEPARTDRPAPPVRAFGNVSARGRWTQPSAGEPRVDLDMQLEKSAIVEIITLLYGRDIGIHGMISSRAHLSGPVSDIRITGRMNIEELHRWDQMPAKGAAWPLPFEGRLDLPAQSVELESQSSKAIMPLAVRFWASEFLSRPRWGVSLNWNQFPVEPLVELARHMGTPLPPKLKLAGSLDGVVAYAGQGSVKGELAFHDTALTIPDSPPIEFEHAKLLFDGDRVHLAPAGVRTSDEDQAELEADYQWGTQAFSLTVSSKSMHVASLHSQAALAAIPFVDQLASGVWNGQLRYDSPGADSRPGGWSGRFDLEEAELSLPELSEPVRLESASVQLQGDRIVMEHMRARVGDVRVQGEYRYEPQVSRPHRCRLVIADLDAAELERLFLPALQRRRGLIARALGRAPVPAWLTNRHLEGTVQIGSLKLLDSTLQRFRARLLWDGTRAELDDIQARVEKGTVAARLSANLRGSAPFYRLVFKLKGFPWKGGDLDSDSAIETSGAGAALLANMRAEGSFHARALAMAPEFETISGCYQIEWAQPAPRFRFTELQLSDGNELYIGSGATQDDGRLLIQLSSGHRHFRVTGTLAQLSEKLRLTEIAAVQ